MKIKLSTLIASLIATLLLGACGKQEVKIAPDNKLSTILMFADTQEIIAAAKEYYTQTGDISRIANLVQWEGISDLEPLLAEIVKDLEAEAAANNPEAMYKLALHFLQDGDNAKSEEFIKKAQALNYPDAFAISLQSESRSQFIKNLKRGIELGSFMCARNLYYQEKNSAKKDELFKTMCKLAKKPSDKNTLAWLLTYAEKKEDALQALKKSYKDGYINNLPTIYFFSKELNRSDANQWLAKIEAREEPFRTLLSIQAKYVPDMQTRDSSTHAKQAAMWEELLAAGAKTADFKLAQYYLAPKDSTYTLLNVSSYKNSHKVPRNKERGLELLNSAYERGNSRAAIMLTDVYCVLENAPEKAKPILLDLAEKNNVEACARVYINYKYGLNTFEQNIEKAESVEKRALERNKRQYRFALGAAMYTYGISNDINHKESTRITRITLTKHNIDEVKRFFKHQFNAASDEEREAFAKEFGIDAFYGFSKALKLAQQKDFPNMFKLIEEASKQGLIEADATLAICYGEGIGVEKNQELSDKYLNKIIKQLPSLSSFDLSAVESTLNPTYYDSILSKLQIKPTPESYFLKFLDHAFVTNFDGVRYSAINYYKRKKDDDKLNEIYQKIAAEEIDSYTLLPQDIVSFYCASEKYKDEKKAFEIALSFEDMLNSNNSGAHILPFMYMEGIGTEKDPKKAFEMLSNKRVFDSDSKTKALRIYCIKNGIGTEANPEEAEKLMRELVKQEESYTIESLSRDFIQSHKSDYTFKFFPKAPMEGIKYLELLAEAGNSAPLADIYRQGIKGVMDPKPVEAMQLYENIKNKNAHQYYIMQNAYLSEKETTDYPKAFNLFAEFYKKHPDSALNFIKYRDTSPAVFQMVYCYLTGNVVEKNEDLAFTLLNEFERKSPRTKELLAYCHQFGLGTQKDETKAATLRTEVLADVNKMNPKNKKKTIAEFINAYESGFEIPDNKSFPFPQNDDLKKYWETRLDEFSENQKQ